MLVGQHDFTTFRSAHCQSESPVKTLDRLTSSAIGDEIEIEAAARSFLHHQVRSMVGCLELVGRGKWTAGRIGGAGGEGPRRAGLQRAARRALFRRGDSTPRAQQISRAAGWLEEGLRAGAEAVGAGAEHRDEVAGLGPRHHDVVGEPVERRAQAADDRHLLLGLGAETAGDRDRIVAAHDLAEIAAAASWCCMPPSVTRKVLPWLTFRSTIRVR